MAKIGILFGMENTFPGALVDRINAMEVPGVTAEFVQTGAARMAPTPAGLGALEATQVGVFALADGRLESGLVSGMAVRMHETLWMTIGFAVLYAQGASLRRLRAAPTPGGTIA